MTHCYIARVVVVEDEAPFMEDLLQQIDACKLSVSVVGTAQSAMEAYEIIKRERPDVVLSDIRMPGMDGLALIARLHVEFPHIRCVLISGYMDFTYAKRALSLGVNEYLIKPVNQAELSACLSDIYADLTGPHHQVQKSLLSSELSSVHQPEIDLHFANPYFFMFAVCIGNRFDLIQYKWISDSYYTQLSQLNFSETIGMLFPTYRVWVVNRTEQNQCFVFLAPLIDSPEPEVLAKMLQKNLSACYDGLPVSVIYCDHVISTAEIYQESISMQHVLQKYAQAWRGVLYSSRECATYGDPHAAIRQDEESLLESLAMVSDAVLLRSQLWDMFMERCQAAPLQADLESFLNSVATYFCFKSPTCAGKVDASDYEWLTSKVALSRSAKECFSLFYEALSSALSLSYDMQQSSESLIRQVCNYIDQQFRNQISIDLLARQYYITSEHLIRTFRKCTGYTPLQYIINKRVASAQLLLRIRPPIDVKQIAQMVGYDNPHYFSRLFKANTNMTPSEYRARHDQTQQT